MTSTLLQQGLLLMLAGMGTVFVFLSMLVVAINLLARVLARMPAAVPPAARHAASDQEVAAIAAAIRQHRSRDKSA